MNALTRREAQLFCCLWFMYGLFALLQSGCSAPTLCQSFLLAFYVAKFLIIFCIIVALNSNLERLRAGSIDLARPLTPTQLYMKLRVLFRARLAFVALIASPIVLMFIEMTVLRYTCVCVCM